MLTSYSKRYSAGGITLRILRQGDFPGLFGWVLNVLTSRLLRGRQSEIWMQKRGRDGMTSVERDLKIPFCWLGWGGRGHQPRTTRNASLETGKHKEKGSLPWGLQMEHGPTDP